MPRKQLHLSPCLLQQLADAKTSHTAEAIYNTYRRRGGGAAAKITSRSTHSSSRMERGILRYNFITVPSALLQPSWRTQPCCCLSRGYFLWSISGAALCLPCADNLPITAAALRCGATQRANVCDCDSLFASWRLK